MITGRGQILYEWFWHSGTSLVSPTEYDASTTPDYDLIRNLVSTSGDLIVNFQTMAEVTYGGGSFVDAAQDSDLNINLQVYDANTLEFVRELFSLPNYGNERAPYVADRPEGGFFLTWRQDSGGFTSIIGQMFDENAMNIGGQKAIAWSSNIGQPHGAVLADGSYIVVWASSDRVNGRLLESDGTPIGESFLIGGSNSDAVQPSVAALDDGGFVVSWSEDDEIAARFFTPPIIDELLYGTAGNDFITGGDGDDTIAGRAGDDALWAGAGDEGNDLFYGDAGDDELGGGLGNDTLVGGAGVDVVFGGAGDDLMYGSSIQQAETDGNEIWSGPGNDRAIGSDGDDRLGGGTGDDSIYGNGGNDTIFAGQDGDDLVQAGAGDDLAYGSAGNDSLEGEDGADELYGGSGSDLVDGGAGADTLYGGADEDTIIGGAGDDQLYGGGGADVFVFAEGSGADDVNGFKVDTDFLDLSGASAGFAQLSDVIDAASNEAEGVSISLGGSDSILLIGLETADLQSLQLILA